MARDFNLHGLVRVRLERDRPEDAAILTRQLGPIGEPAAAGVEPDILVRFVDQLETDGTLRILGDSDSGFDDTGFYVLRGKHKAPIRVRIPVDRVGGRITLTCQRGLEAIPHLIAVVNLTALARGALPLHASAFRYRDAGVLVTGWARGGKTEVLLAFADQGAEYVGDEWIYLVDSGRRAFGIPEPIRVWDWHLDELPRFRGRLPARDRARLACLRQAGSWLGRVANGRPPSAAAASSAPPAPAPGPARWRRWVRAAARLAESQRYVHVPPRDAFGTTAGALQMNVDRVIYVASHESRAITVHAVAPESVAARMAFSLEEERKDLVALYRRYRFAFPERANPILERAATLERRRLAEFLRGRPCYAVLHPYPVSIPALHDALRPVVEA